MSAITAFILSAGMWAGISHGVSAPAPGAVVPPGDSARTVLFTLTGKDASGMSHTIRFGLSPAATYGFDRALAEYPMPPSPPPPIFDLRFVDLPGRPRIPATGAYADIRPWPAPASIDTFMVRYYPMNDAYPVRILFDAGMRCCVDSMTILIDGKSSVLSGAMMAEELALRGPSDRFMFIVHWKPMDFRSGPAVDGATVR